MCRGLANAYQATQVVPAQMNPGEREREMIPRCQIQLSVMLKQRSSLTEPCKHHARTKKVSLEMGQTCVSIIECMIDWG